MNLCRDADLREQWIAPFSRAERIERLSSASSPVYLKMDDTVVKDEVVDWLLGGLGTDWFFFDRDHDCVYGWYLSSNRCSCAKTS